MAFPDGFAASHVPTDRVLGLLAGEDPTREAEIEALSPAVRSLIAAYTVEDGQYSSHWDTLISRVVAFAAEALVLRVPATGRGVSALDLLMDFSNLDPGALESGWFWDYRDGDPFLFWMI